ncbi:hypothetical protein SAMN05444158_0843 [Bradyrhizobium canariense]|uniref:DUF6745 domain-containing protein n=1 Tax=Bradyrhizobium canariense TaxID=255045 RepID=A0A1H1P1G3_9BRAD|nr:hypothetical protein SAMN05444158_0843 [Bradyrhizobium canariense]
MRVSLPTEALTPAQTAVLRDYRARWAGIRRSTVSADRSAAEEGARLAYHAAGLKPPARFVWCESPLALFQRAGRASRDDGPNVKSAIIHRPRRQVAAWVGRRLHKRVRAEVERAVNPADALVASVADAVMLRTPDENLSLLMRMRRGYPLAWSLPALLGRQGFRDSAIGQHELSWLAAYDYIRDVLGLQAETAPLMGLWQLATSLGWLQPHEHTCWLAERPNLLRGDAGDRLHSASGPALRFPDGWSVWAWKGVEVPRWVIEQPEQITLASIDGESNVQVRCCMIEIMTPRRYVTLGGAVRVAEDETGVLWRKRWLASDAWAAVEVINATPEPDGTHKQFFLQVPTNMRTAREAVAWTYGLRADAYARLVVRT